MCWINTSKQHIVSIADENMLVYKLLKRSMNDNWHFLSIYYDYVYEVGMPYYKEINTIDAKHKTIENAFHSYSVKNTYLHIVDTFISGHKALYVNQIDDFSSNDCLTILPKYVFALCVIPKYSHYMENKKGEIVSNAIKVIRTFNINDIESISKYVLVK